MGEQDLHGPSLQLRKATALRRYGPRACVLLDAANISTQTGTPKPPTEFKAVPSDLNYLDPKDSNYFGKFLAEYDVEGLDAPPLDNVSLTQTFTLASDDKNFDRGIELSVPEGY